MLCCHRCFTTGKPLRKTFVSCTSITLDNLIRVTLVDLHGCLTWRRKRLTEQPQPSESCPQPWHSHIGTSLIRVLDWQRASKITGADGQDHVDPEQCGSGGQMARKDSDKDRRDKAWLQTWICQTASSLLVIDQRRLQSNPAETEYEAVSPKRIFCFEQNIWHQQPTENQLL